MSDCNEIVFNHIDSISFYNIPLLLTEVIRQSKRL